MIPGVSALSQQLWRAVDARSLREGREFGNRIAYETSWHDHRQVGALLPHSLYDGLQLRRSIRVGLDLHDVLWAPPAPGDKANDPRVGHTDFDGMKFGKRPAREVK